MISVRVIDGMHGYPAKGIETRLDRHVDGRWQQVQLTPGEYTGDLVCHLPTTARGMYRLELGTDAYFASLGVTTLLPKATVVIRVADADAPYRLSVLVTPYAHFVSTSRDD